MKRHDHAFQTHPKTSNPDQYTKNYPNFSLGVASISGTQFIIIYYTGTGERQHRCMDGRMDPRTLENPSTGKLTNSVTDESAPSARQRFHQLGGLIMLI